MYFLSLVVKGLIAFLYSHRQFPYGSSQTVRAMTVIQQIWCGVELFPNSTNSLSKRLTPQSMATQLYIKFFLSKLDRGKYRGRL